MGRRSFCGRVTVKTYRAKCETVSFVCLFVCLFVVSRCERLQNCGVAFRGVVYIYVRGFIRLFIVFGQFFDLEGGKPKGRKIFGAKKTLACLKK